MNRISVFCGSSFGKDEIFEKQAYLLGQTLAKLKIGLVFGGSSLGLMGAVAYGALSEGGEAIGVFPDFMKKNEIAFDELTKLIYVKTMHDRKMMMNELSDGVITLPGGFGTLEEFFEMLAWSQLKLHKKPVAILNINGFYDDLIALIQTMVNKGFLNEANQKILIIDDDIGHLLEKMKNWIPSNSEKSFDRSSASRL